MNHVLVARLDSLGDVLLAGPAVRAVAASADRVTMLCSSKGAEAAALLPGVDRLMIFDAPWISRPAPPVDDALLDLVDRVRNAAVDEAIILTSHHQSPLPLALLCRLAHVRTVGAICEDYPGALLDVRHHVDDNVHEVARAVSLVRACGHRLPKGDDGCLRIKSPAHPARRQLPAPFVVVHPGATAPARTWSPERFRGLVRELHRRGHRVVVTGGPGEKKLTRFVADGTEGATDAGGRTDLAELAAVLAEADVVIAGNTGPAHLAAAVGTPVVSIFPPTVPAQRWRPWGVEHAVFGDQAIGCAGCRAIDCPRGDHQCVASVPIHDVADAVDDLASDAATAAESAIDSGLGKVS